MADDPVVYAPTHFTNAKAQLGLNSFSVPPTIDEINASSDWYQVVGLFNRRQSQIYDSPSYFTLGYGGIGNWPTADSISDLRDAINAVRADLDMTPATFSIASLDAGHVIHGLDLTQLRTALALTSTRQATTSGLANNTTTVTFIPFNGFRVGRQFTDRYRIGESFAIPSATLVSSTTAVLRFTVLFLSGSSPVVRLYASNTDDNALPASWMFHTDNYVGSATISAAGTYDIAVPFSVISAAAGRHLSFVLVDENEFLGNATFTLVTFSNSTRFDLIFDYGF